MWVSGSSSIRSSAGFSGSHTQWHTYTRMYTVRHWDFLFVTLYLLCSCFEIYGFLSFSTRSTANRSLCWTSSAEYSEHSIDILFAGTCWVKASMHTFIYLLKYWATRKGHHPPANYILNDLLYYTDGLRFSSLVVVIVEFISGTGFSLSIDCATVTTALRPSNLAGVFCWVLVSSYSPLRRFRCAYYNDK
jgi:hypothetical protein